ncbi:MAG: Gluconate transporter [Xanthobacteraceae bacterium]|jgi:GntP family gluconate:H+ symporter|nr:Gluconate transporter [Xanthobacteraceae bacterium]
MSLQQAACFLVVLAVFIALTQRWRVQSFLALILAGAGFGYAAGMATSQVGKAFGLGFQQGVATLGLIVVAGAMLTEIADATGASARIRAAARGWHRRSLPLTLIGVIAGLASTPAAAFAVLSPLRRAIGGEAPRPALALGLAVSASHGLLLPAPVILAAVTILGADWSTALLYGLPTALVAAIAGAFVARSGSAEDDTLPASTEAMDGETLHAPGRAALALILVSAVLVGLLVVQSLGDIASEPLGGGSNREFLLGLGRPLILMLVGVGAILLLTWHWPHGGLTEEGWPGRAIARAAGLVLTVGAAAGLSKLAQETGMAEMNAERLLAWQPGPALVLALPFALAAIMKLLQGSSLAAAITAAGMMMELLGPLGLDDATGRACAALAIGAGAMAASHINDGLFWLVTDAARLRPGASLACFSLGTVLQGAVALAALILLRLVTV